MRKISHKLKQYFLRRRARLEKKIGKRTIKKASNLKAPEVLDFANNYEETVRFFSDLRDISERSPLRFNINFKAIRKISASAALVFTGEMDRIKKISGKGIRVIDYHKWDPNIRNLLREMGMYDLLMIPNITEEKTQFRSDEQFMKFQTGDKANGDDATKLQKIIANVTGIVPGNKNLQKGLTEAMTNVSNHAYPKDYLAGSLFKKKQWWMSASFNNATKKLTIIFYDQGIGIPTSLPRTTPEKVRKALNLLLFSDDDGKMIEAAVKLGRSRTEETHRGGGLEDIKNYISDSNIENGYFRIYSNKGEFYYKKNDKDEEEGTRNRAQKLHGTLIEWQVCIKNKNNSL